MREFLEGMKNPRRVIMSLLGVIITGMSVGLFRLAALGVSTYDAIAIVMSGKWHWGKFKYIRIATDVVCVILGCSLFLLAGHEISEVPTIAGVGTVITAFFMGPLIDLFNRKIAIPILNAGKKKDAGGAEV